MASGHTPLTTLSPMQALLARLQRIAGLTVEPSPVAGGFAVFLDGSELGHFHSDTEIDLRLTRRVIKALGLIHPPPSAVHPARRATSMWIELRFHNEEDAARAASVIEQAVPRLRAGRGTARRA